MKKRTFIKTASAMVAGGIFSPMLSCMDHSKETNAEIKTPGRTNWAGNLEYHASSFLEHDSIEDLSQLIKENEKIRVLGTRHCFNALADTKYTQVSIRKFNRLLSVDAEKKQAIIEAGASYGQICKPLYEQGFALHNLASLPHISVAGAAATATHGSGIHNPNLGTVLAGFEFIDANGELQEISKVKDGELFTGMVTHLGCLGVITKLVLQLQPAYEVQQQVFLDLPVTELLSDFPGIMGSGYSVSLFTDYQSDKINQVWIKNRVEPGQPVEKEKSFRGAQAADRKVHPIIKLSAESCTEQLGEPGPWYDRLPHFKMEFTPSSGKELQTEFFVPADKAVDAFHAIEKLREPIGSLLMISEIRSIAADEQWMSPCYHQDSIAFHFTWEQDMEKLSKLLPDIESALAPFNARPHWGKISGIKGEKLRGLYPNLPKFKEVIENYDPKGKFRNEFLTESILPG